MTASNLNTFEPEAGEDAAMMFFAEKITENIEETPEGFLICRNVSLARVGLMEYQNTGQIEGVNSPTVQIGHNEETLSSEETIASFEGKSITIEHPNEMLDPDNISEHTVGHIQNVHYDVESQTLVADLVIITTESIKLVKNGLREVSCGYWADIKPNGDGTGTLINVMGNHLALVANGRCGSKCSINDSQEITMTEKETLFQKIAALFDSADKKDDDKKDDESVFDAKEAFDGLIKRMDDLEAKVASKDDGVKKDDDEEGEEATPTKEDQILALLNKLLEMEATEQKDDDDDDDDGIKDSIMISINDSAYADEAFKTPSISELNAKYAAHFGGK